MLVLTRKTNERIRIGDDVEVVVVSIRGDKVRLGVRAPRDVVVDRDEVSRKRRSAAGVAVDATEVRHGA